MSPTRAFAKVDRLADRFLDPRRAFTVRHDDARRALCANDPEAARRWQRRMALHRALVGAERASGLEDARHAALIASRALPTRSASRWRWWAPVLAACAALVLVMATQQPGSDPRDVLAPRGGHSMAGAPVVGFGVSGVGDDDSEYDVLSRALHAGDWIRLSYSNEREDLDWLFLVALTDEAIVWLIPSPDEGQSVPIGVSWQRPLEVETRIAAEPGAEVVFIGVFSREPVTVDAMRSALGSLPPSGPDLYARAATVDNHLRTRLALGPDDRVQVGTTHVAKATREDSDEPPAEPSAPHQEAP